MSERRNKASIPKTLKDYCWNHWIGEDKAKAKCMCCERAEIKMNNFHCGHLISESNGGNLSYENLRPICASCNLSMGSENMGDFKERCSFGSRDSLYKPVQASIYYKKFENCMDLIPMMCIPSVQRDINENHIKNLRNHIQDFHSLKKEPLFSSVDLAFLEGKFYVCDGQHRITAIRREYEENKIIVPIHAMIYNVYTYEELEQIFRTKNMNLPIPDFILNLDEKKMNLLKQIHTYLLKKYPNIFDDKKILRPYINTNFFIETYRNSIYYNSIETLENFIELFEKENQKAKEIVQNMDEKNLNKHKISEKMLKVWTENNLYIGYSKGLDFLIPK